MSRVSFHSVGNTVEIWGAERAMFDQTATSIGVSPINNFNWRIIAAHTADRKKNDHPASLEEVLRLRGDFWGKPIVTFDDEKAGFSDLVASTAVVLGSDLTALGSKIHSYCEIHGWFKVEDWPWVIGILKGGLESGQLREQGNWNELFELDPQSQVVMDYSVTESFLCAPTAGFEHDDHGYAAFERLSDKEQWTRCCATLEEGVRIGPDTFRLGFACEFTLIDFFRADHKECCDGGKRNADTN